MSSSVGDAHEKAMELADEALELRRRGRHVAAFSKFREASWLESQAADEISSKLQPGHGVLHRSAAIVALDANRLGEATRLIDAGLEAAPILDVREELEDLKQLVTPVGAVTRMAPAPVVFLEYALDSLSWFVPEMIIEVEESGRVAQRAAELSLGTSPRLFIYRKRSEFDAWKDMALDALPPRLRFSVEDDPGGEYPRFVGEIYGALDAALELALEEILHGPPESFDFPVRNHG